LDTNIIILLADGTFNLNKEIERLIPQKHVIIFLSACLEEFNYLVKKKPKMVKYQQFAEKIIKTLKVVDFNPPDIRTTDSKILAFAGANVPNCVVVTNDKRLKKRLLENDIPVIFLRTKTHLELLGSV
jgi:rRNA-processing protein FCF1